MVGNCVFKKQDMVGLIMNVALVEVGEVIIVVDPEPDLILDQGLVQGLVVEVEGAMVDPDLNQGQDLEMLVTPNLNLDPLQIEAFQDPNLNQNLNQDHLQEVSHQKMVTEVGAVQEVE